MENNPQMWTIKTKTQVNNYYFATNKTNKINGTTETNCAMHTEL